MSIKSSRTGSSSHRPASLNGGANNPQQVFVVEIENEQYRVSADSRTSAKYRAANAHKEQTSGLEIGRNVGEIAGIASIIGSMRAE